MCFLKNLSKSEISSGLTIDVTWNPSASRLLFVLVWRADALQLLRCWITPIVPASSFLGTSHRPYIRELRLTMSSIWQSLSRSTKRVIVPSDVFCFFLRIHAHRSCLWHSIYGPSIPEFMHVGTIQVWRGLHPPCLGHLPQAFILRRCLGKCYNSRLSSRAARLAWACTAAFYKMSEVMFRLSEAISLRQGYRQDHPVGEASTFLAAHEYRSAGNR